jgi:hypothetical protein
MAQPPILPRRSPTRLDNFLAISIVGGYGLAFASAEMLAVPLDNSGAVLTSWQSLQLYLPFVFCMVASYALAYRITNGVRSATGTIKTLAIFLVASLIASGIMVYITFLSRIATG